VLLFFCFTGVDYADDCSNFLIDSLQIHRKLCFFNEVTFKFDELVFKLNEVAFKIDKVVFKLNEVVFKIDEVVFKLNEVVFKFDKVVSKIKKNRVFNLNWGMSGCLCRVLGA